MKALVAVILAALVLAGCAQIPAPGKILRVTYYAYNGDAIRTWEGNITVEQGYSRAYVTDQRGNRYTINGPYIIEEINK